jgi:hypothetical protein
MFCKYVDDIFEAIKKQSRGKKYIINACNANGEGKHCSFLLSKILTEEYHSEDKPLRMGTISVVDASDDIKILNFAVLDDHDFIVYEHLRKCVVAAKKHIISSVENRGIVYSVKFDSNIKKSERWGLSRQIITRIFSVEQINLIYCDKV